MKKKSGIRHQLVLEKQFTYWIQIINIIIQLEEII